MNGKLVRNASEQLRPTGAIDLVAPLIANRDGPEDVGLTQRAERLVSGALCISADDAITCAVRLGASVVNSNRTTSARALIPRICRSLNARLIGASVLGGRDLPLRSVGGFN